MKQTYKTFLRKNLPKLFIFHFSLFIFTACGYKPSSHMIANVFDDTVYVEVVVDRVEPENAPTIKDAINRMVYTRFKGKVVSKAQAKSEIKVSYAGSRFVPLSYADGYVTRYSVVVNVTFDMLTKQGRISKTITAVQETDIHTSSLRSSTLRTEAIGKAVAKALDEFLAYASAKGALQSER